MRPDTQRIYNNLDRAVFEARDKKSDLTPAEIEMLRKILRELTEALNDIS